VRDVSIMVRKLTYCTSVLAAAMVGEDGEAAGCAAVVARGALCGRESSAKAQGRDSPFALVNKTLASQITAHQVTVLRWSTPSGTCALNCLAPGIAETRARDHPLLHVHLHRGTSSVYAHCRQNLML
jgi:hypothetical protein